MFKIISLSVDQWPKLSIINGLSETTNSWYRPAVREQALRTKVSESSVLLISLQEDML